MPSANFQRAFSSRSNISPASRVTVTAPARLHMGFLDLGGALGRRFGSIGVGINEIRTRLTLTPASHLSTTGPDAARAAAAVAKVARVFNLPDTVHIRVESAIPGHAGLGSGTQLGLSAGMGLCSLHGRGTSVRELAALIERGTRSGIGIAVFEGGGLVLDGGRGERTLIPPLLARMELPSHWRFLLILDDRGQGVHGKAEIDAFRSLPVFSAVEAARLCHLLLMRGLPAVAENDLAGFGAVISELQRTVGDHFAPAQGGRFSSQEVKEALCFLESRGAVGIGQSSWGPTGFCLVDGPQSAADLLVEAQTRFAACSHLRFLIGTARNRGADIQLDEPQS